MVMEDRYMMKDQATATIRALDLCDTSYTIDAGVWQMVRHGARLYPVINGATKYTEQRDSYDRLDHFLADFWMAY